ncbi:hypothetical protein C0J52_06053 [Blattella germanica]|nr:hypothetical protein C0J52_06053 [Blattella germanica]
MGKQLPHPVETICYPWSADDRFQVANSPTCSRSGQILKLNHIEELKRRIEDEIVRIDEDMLRRVMGDFTRRLGECIENEGGHLLRTIFKK